ncbi:hypothetical protein GF406_08335 [candidate division KSB1 bacterium]|nr:hypothetical protein [candidate division KSB1 bacterium]
MKTYAGYETQFTNDDSQLTDIVVGFDFGASCSKIILRTPSIREEFFVVPFSDKVEGELKYLFPTKIYYHEDSLQISLLKFDGAESKEHLKLRCLRSSRDNPLSERCKFTAKELTVAYIANVLQHIRAWFLTEHQNGYKQYKLYWRFNFGYPSGRFPKNYTADFSFFAKAGWWLSLQKEITLENASLALRNVHNLDFNCGLERDDINILSEIAATITGYAKSNYRKDGLKLLVDVGASTLDIAAFELHRKDGDDIYSVLESDVQLLGAFLLYERKLQIILERIRKHFNHIHLNADIYKPVPEDIKIDWNKVCEIDPFNIDIFQKAKKMIKKIIIQLKRNLDPLSPAWHDGLPLFLSGGGKNLFFYKRVLSDVEVEMRYHHEFKKFVEPPNPIKLGKDFNDSSRFLVAFGLSYPPEEIGEIREPDKIKKIKRLVRNKYEGIEMWGKEVE